ncbi:MAG: Uma2 family endonuclease [Caulobacteraceae bacterium]
MNAPLRQPMTLEAFLDWEDRQPLRHEFDGLQAIAMAGGTVNHAAIQANLAVAMTNRLRGTKCRFFGSDLKIEVVGRIRYPDGFVVCSPLAPDAKVIADPVVIFEILSDATSRTDHLTKNDEYARTPSVRRYVILAQDAPGGTMFERVGDDWVGHLLSRDSVLRMPELGAELPMSELYDGVDVAEPERFVAPGSIGESA